MQEHSTQASLFDQPPEKRCRKCDHVKPLTDFSVLTHKVYGPRYRVSWCKPCAAAAKKARSKTTEGRRAIRSAMLKNSYGITLEEYQAMHDAQQGLCAICGKPETAVRSGNTLLLATDHSHSSGVVRGLLCSCCNAGIGFFKESPELLHAAVAYLRHHAS